jgi:hypothetical protein
LPIALLALVLITALAPWRAQAEPALPDSLPADSALTDTAAVIPPPIPPRAMLRVETQPSGLRVEIDGTSIGRSPVGPMAVPPGTHRVRAHPADPRRFCTSITETVVTLAEGTESTVRLDVRPPVVVRTNPEPALVTLTGPSASDSLLGSTPLSIRPSVIESAYLRFTREAFADTTVAGAAFVTQEPFRVSLRQTSTVASRSGSKGPTSILSKRWFQWTLVGVGAVLTGAAAVWHNEADHSYDEYLASSNVDEIPGLYDRTIDYDRRATASFIVGQACMITGALLYLTGQSQ